MKLNLQDQLSKLEAIINHALNGTEATVKTAATSSETTKSTLNKTILAASKVVSEIYNAKFVWLKTLGMIRALSSKDLNVQRSAQKQFVIGTTIIIFCVTAANMIPHTQVDPDVYLLQQRRELTRQLGGPNMFRDLRQLGGND